MRLKVDCRIQSAESKNQSQASMAKSATASTALEKVKFKSSKTAPGTKPLGKAPDKNPAPKPASKKTHVKMHKKNKSSKGKGKTIVYIQTSSRTNACGDSQTRQIPHRRIKINQTSSVRQSVECSH